MFNEGYLPKDQNDDKPLPDSKKVCIKELYEPVAPWNPHRASMRNVVVPRSKYKNLKPMVESDSGYTTTQVDSEDEDEAPDVRSLNQLPLPLFQYGKAHAPINSETSLRSAKPPSIPDAQELRLPVSQWPLYTQEPLLSTPIWPLAQRQAASSAALPGPPSSIPWLSAQLTASAAPQGPPPTGPSDVDILTGPMSSNTDLFRLYIGENCIHDIDDNCPLNDTPKSDLWYISSIVADTLPANDIYSRARFLGGSEYIKKVERMFAETILAVSTRSRRTQYILKDELTHLLWSEVLLSLFELMYPDNIVADDTSMLIGGSNAVLNTELAFKETDTQHDFKPGRNKVYPQIIQGKGVNKEAGLNVYGKLNSVIGNSRPPTYGHSYIMSSPIAFEENIKVDYLLGDLFGQLEDIYYYFTDVNSTPSTWSKLRQDFFGIQGDQIKVNSINALVNDVKERGYNGWILDACVSGRVSSSLGERKKTLANIWDPVKGKFQQTDLIDSAVPFTLIEEKKEPGYTIYDCKFNDRNRPSLYDSVYDNLLNKDLEAEGVLRIQLRLAVNDIRPNICGVAIVIIIGETKKYFIIECGFPVQVLAQGMRYIDDKYSSERPYTTPIDTNLQTIIDYVDNALRSFYTDNIARSAIIQKMLYRFKSSGDHGTSDTVKLLNQLELYYLFLSGDNLAYVYAMSSIGNGAPTPTIATYYKESKKKSKESDEEDEDEEEDDAERSSSIESDDTKIEGNHFIVAYFPAGDDEKKNYTKLIENIKALYELAKVVRLALPTSVQAQIDVDGIIVYIADQNTRLEPYIKGQQTLLLSPYTITTEFTGTVSRILESIVTTYPSFISLGGILSVDYLMATLPLDLATVKALSSSLNKLVNKLYFMHKYSEIVTLSEEMIRADRAAFAPIVSLDQAQSSGRSQRSITTKLTTAYNAVKKSLMENLRGFSSAKRGQPSVPTVSELQSALKQNKITDTKSEYERINTIKEELSTNSKSLFKRMKERLGFSDPFIASMKDEILTISNPLITQLKQDILTNSGGQNDPFAKTLVTMFDDVLQTKISRTSMELDEPAASASASAAAQVRKPNSWFSGGRGKKNGAKSVKRHNLHKSKLNTKKRSRLRKTRKNTKRPKYIKKNVTKRRR